jgi:hypothetical protein
LEGTLSRWSRLYLQLHWAPVVGYGPFSLWVIYKEGLCPSSGDITRLMMKIMIRKAKDVSEIETKEKNTC